MTTDDEAQMFRKLLDASPGMVILIDDQLNIKWVNQAASDLLGYSLDEGIGRSIMDFLDPDWDPEMFDSIATAMSGQGLRPPSWFRVISRDGSTSIMEVTANSQFDDPVLRGMVAYARPWTERWLLDRTLDSMAAGEPVRKALELLVEVAGADTLSASASLLYDQHDTRVGGIIAAKSLAPELTGPHLDCSEDVAAAWAPLLASDHGDVHDVADLPEVLRHPAEAAGFQTLWVWPSERSHADTGAAWAVAWRDEPHLDTDQTRRQLMARLATLCGLSVDRARRRAETAYAATHDALTGLHNRASFFDQLDALLAAAGDGTLPVGVIYLDLDRFKPINDRYGHGAGDRVLVEIAHRLRQAAPLSGTMARLGGDEFAFVDRAGPDGLASIASRLNKVVATPIELRAGEAVTLGVSVGFASVDTLGTSSDALVDAADRALYEAKRTGGGIRRGTLASDSGTHR